MVDVSDLGMGKCATDQHSVCAWDTELVLWEVLVAAVAVVVLLVVSLCV